MINDFETFINENFTYKPSKASIPKEIPEKLWSGKQIPDNLFLKDSKKIVINIEESLRVPFLKKIVWICEDLEINPNWLMAVLYLESGFNPRAENRHSSAKGLIQFIDSTSKSNFGIGSDEIPKNPIRQLDFVYAYLYGRMKSNPPETMIDMYLHIFYPVAVNKPLTYKFKDSAVSNNRGLFGYYPRSNEKYGTKEDLVMKLTNKDSKSIFAKLAEKEKFSIEKVEYGKDTKNKKDNFGLAKSNERISNTDEFKQIMSGKLNFEYA